MPEKVVLANLKDFDVLVRTRVISTTEFLSSRDHRTEWTAGLTNLISCDVQSLMLGTRYLLHCIRGCANRHQRYNLVYHSC